MDGVPHEEVRRNISNQTREIVFNHIYNHREENWKYDAQRSIFGELRTVLSVWYISSLIYSFWNWPIANISLENVIQKQFVITFESKLKTPRALLSFSM